LAQSEAALERAENAPSGAAETGDRLRKMNQEAEQAHAERESKSATYESARSASTSTLAVLIGDQQLESLLDQLDAARTKLATLRKTMTDLHPAVVDALATVDKLQRAIDNRRSDLLLRLRLDYEDANRKDNELRGQIAAAESALRDTSHTPPVALLKQDVETNRQNYEQRLEQAKQKRPANAAQEAGVVDLATPPLIPYKPSPLRNVAYGTFAGLLLGLVGAVLWARLDSNIQAPGEAAQYTGAGELGLIPEVNLRGKPPEFKVELAAWQDRLSPTATAFHATATSVLFAFGSEPDGVGAVVVLTSVGASDGKTSTATNLAVAISEARKRVLLIDADTIRPRLRGIFELPSDSGLAELLAGTEPLDEKTLADATQASRFSGLDVLTSGAGGEQAAELLHSPRLPELLALARAKYDFVLIDSPPMLQIPHARIFGRLSDGVILVARAGRTPRASLQAAAAKLREDGTPILGTVLNCWNPRGVGGYGYEAYAQSYKRYGGSRSL
jgi:capsular exopolysaccharide synthesis family protein